MIEQAVERSERLAPLRQARAAATRGWRRNVRQGVLEVGPAALGIAGLCLGWELVVRAQNVPPYVIPAPSAIFARLWETLPALLFELQYTLVAAFAGLLCGSAVGIAGATLMIHWRTLERSLFPLAVILKLTPFVAIAPLLVVWLGYNLWPRIVIAALITFFPVLVNCLTGLRAVDPLALEFFESLGASKAEVFGRLRWRASLPYLAAALKVCINLGLIGAIVGEFFGAEFGIGKVINQSALKLDMRTMFAGITVLGLTGITLTVLANAVERRVLFWHESSRTVG